MNGLRMAAASADDYPGLLALNEDAVPHVNSIGIDKLAHLHRQSVRLGVARDAAGELAGFLLALPETADYDSENFGYFRRHYPSFVYVDRIVVSARHRRRGVGAALYADLAENLPAGCALLTCEVNVDPPNDASMVFHRQMGFEPVGEQTTEGGKKTVCLLVRRLR